MCRPLLKRDYEKKIFDSCSENKSTGTYNGSKKYKSLSPNVNIGFKPVTVPVSDLITNSTFQLQDPTFWTLGNWDNHNLSYTYILS
jgi:hypothetical protein